MEILGINIIAVIICAIAAMMTGTLWFGFIFRDAFLKEIGKTQEDIANGPNMAPVWVMQFLGSAISAATLGWLMARLGIETPGGGVSLGFIVWFGFVVAILGPTFAWHGNSLRHFGIVAGNLLAGLLLAGLILGFWPW